MAWDRLTQCVECGNALLGDGRYGYLTLNVSVRTGLWARVHTVCREQFEARPAADRLARAEKGPT